MAGEPKLIVGLGNPGIEYQFTYHNLGFLAVDRIAEHCGVQVNNRRCQSLTATVTFASRKIVLAKPETYMNLSGLAVRALVDLHGVLVRDSEGRPVIRSSWDFQDLDGFVASARQAAGRRVG